MSLAASVRRANPNDSASISRMATASPGAPHWSPSQYEDMLQASAEKDASRAIFLAETNGLAIGFCVVSVAAENAELESIAVIADQRRRGLARHLYQEANAWLLERGAQEVWLEVRESNLAARAFYRSLAFTETGRRRSYYADPKERCHRYARHRGCCNPLIMNRWFATDIYTV